jgi:hypothetical protein
MDDDKTGSRSDELILKRKADDKRNQLMGRCGSSSSSSSSSRRGMHPGIGSKDTGSKAADQIDKLNNWIKKKQHIE